VIEVLILFIFDLLDVWLWRPSLHARDAADAAARRTVPQQRGIVERKLKEAVAVVEI